MNFTQNIEDISGNCFLSNPKAPERDPRTEVSLFVRNTVQDHALGIYTREELENEPAESDNTGVLAAPEEKMAYESLLSEVFQLPANCPSCNAPCKVNTKLTSLYLNRFIVPK